MKSLFESRGVSFISKIAATALLILGTTACGEGNWIVIEGEPSIGSSADDDNFEDWAATSIGYPNPFENSLAEPLGGGVGFSSIIDPDDADYLVSDKAELLAAINDANDLPDNESAPIIYVEDSATINLTNNSIKIKRPLVLASGRGRNGSMGALLYTWNGTDASDTSNQKLFWVRSDDVHFTGLRIRGPHTKISYPKSENWFHGIIIGKNANFTKGNPSDPANGFLIDNCELWGWSGTAVYFASSRQGVAAYNYIHHNRRSSNTGSQGYGVKVTGDAQALVQGNVFNYIRHAIAGSGQAGQEYEARYNFVGTQANGHTFDMHGACEAGHSTAPADGMRCDDPDGQLAGSFVWIHHNIVLQRSKAAVNIRGKSTYQSIVENNYFAHYTGWGSVEQKKIICNFNSPDCAYTTLVPQRPYKNLKVSNNTLRFRFIGRSVSWGGNSNWYPISKNSTKMYDMAVADFNGDGVDDLLKTTGKKWQVSWNGTSEWKNLNSSSYQLNNIALHDFDGDGSTDIFKAASGKWKVSYSGTTRWTFLNTSSYKLHQLRFGDFDGNGTTDIMRLESPYCSKRSRYARRCTARKTRAKVSWGGHG